jgi:hypothetical protein
MTSNLTAAVVAVAACAAAAVIAVAAVLHPDVQSTFPALVLSGFIGVAGVLAAASIAGNDDSKDDR